MAGQSEQMATSTISGLSKTVWWKFDRYEIKDNYIQPAPGAELRQFDPWEEQHRSRIDSSVQPLYQGILAMLKQLGVDYLHYPWEYAQLVSISRSRGKPMMKFTPRAGIAHAPLREGQTSWPASIESEIDTWKRYPRDAEKREAESAAILNWCNRYGLLGVLPHVAQRCTVHPRRISGGRFMAKWEVTTYSRANGRWTSGLSYEMGRGLAAEPEVLLQSDEQFSDGQQSVALEGIEETWGHFFPSVPVRTRREYRYPCPLSEEFWHVYAEPVPVFVRHALVLQQAIEPLAPGSDLGRIIAQEKAIAFLNGLIAPIAQEAFISTAGVRQRWVFPSLLSILAKMALEDLALGALFRYCTNCDMPFVSNAYQQLYCSKTCAWRDRKRKARAAKRTGSREEADAKSKTRQL